MRGYLKAVISLSLSCCLLNVNSAFAEEIRYVSSLKAKLLEAPQFKAPLVAQLNKGDQVFVKKQQGVWLQVSTTSGASGWVSKFLTKTTPPTDRVTVLPGTDENQLKDVRRRTSALTTAAAARGLAAKSARDTSSKYKDNKEAVKYMESFKISEADLNAFAEAIQGAQQ